MDVILAVAIVILLVLTVPVLLTGTVITAWGLGHEVARKVRSAPLLAALGIELARAPLPSLIRCYLVVVLCGCLSGLFHRHQSRLGWGLPAAVLGGLAFGHCAFPFVLAGALLGAELALERRLTVLTLAAVLLLPLLGPDRSGYLLLLPLVAAAVAARPLLRHP